MSELVFRERPASGDPDGLLVLHHGRGADEHDLLGLADTLDHERRLHVVTPRAPLTLSGWPGYHWYLVPGVGYPDPASFSSTFERLALFHDELWQRTGIAPERTVLGGFSMGAAMSYALGLAGSRPAPAGIMAFSGFIPTVAGWSPALAERRAVRAFIAHGREDPVITVQFARDAHDRLRSAGLSVDYREFAGGHAIDPADLSRARDWLAASVPAQTIS